MSDYIISGTACDHQIRFFATTTAKLVDDARTAHNTSPVATAALGRLLTAGTLMGAMCKNETDVVTLQIQCQGPIGGLTVTAGATGKVKGYVNNPIVLLPPSDKGKLDVGKALDLGILTVIKDLGMPSCYSGQTHLVSGEIAEDLTYYFATSEQIPTSVSLGVLMEKNNTVKCAGGYIIQLMPFASEECISNLETTLANFPAITSLFEKNHTPEEIIQMIFADSDVNFNDPMPTEFYCDCSKEKMRKGLDSISKKDIQEMIDDGESIEVNCHFCNSFYNFEVEELKELL